MVVFWPIFCVGMEQHATDALRYGLTRRKVECYVGRVYVV
jgi:hypothetical protein